MMNEEEYLRSRMGTKNPFTVPEGYFEQLTAQVMDRLPEKKPAKVAVMKRLRPWLYAAACVCVGVFVAAVAFNQQTEDLQGQQQMANMGQENVNYYSDSYIDEAADYAMIDSQEIYSYLLADMY
ncbi:MAG: hypothetical protein K6A96_03290 [Prevotella sp.]|jgi:hypothetical protein|nr:hypothetical protein [Prevotella sp.]